jgi:hypothetical protein
MPSSHTATYIYTAARFRVKNSRINFVIRSLASYVLSRTSRLIPFSDQFKLVRRSPYAKFSLLNYEGGQKQRLAGKGC